MRANPGDVVARAALMGENVDGREQTKSDILDRAEAILTNARSEWAVRDMQAEYALSILSDLVAEIKQQAAYVARLEAAYLKAQAAWTFYADVSSGARWYEAKPDEVAVCNQAAREALERIKRGEKE